LTQQGPVSGATFGEPLLVVVSGPSGVGKDAVFQYMRNLDRGWHFVVTATTRQRRRDERNGVDYIFLDRDEFERMHQSELFLESAQVYGNWYGVPKQQVREALAQGRDVLMKIDVQGAATVRKLAPGAVMIFLAPPSVEELERRLRFRASESLIDLRNRLEAAKFEMARIHEFQYKVVNQNHRLDLAAFCIESIMAAEKCRVGRGRVEIL